MTEVRKKILDDVSAERDRQIAKWTGTFDDAQWNCADWHEMITDYSAWARRMGAMGSPEKQRRRLIQVAALAVAAVEVIDEKMEKKRIDALPVCTDACSVFQHASSTPECAFKLQHFADFNEYCDRPGGPVTGEKR